MPFHSVVSVTTLDGVARGSGLVIGGTSATPTSAPRMKQSQRGEDYQNVAYAWKQHGPCEILHSAVSAGPVEEFERLVRHVRVQPLAYESEVHEGHYDRQAGDAPSNSRSSNARARRHREEQTVYRQNDELVLLRASQEEGRHDAHRPAPPVQSVDQRCGEKRHEGHLVKIPDAVWARNGIEGRDGD